MGWLSKLFGGVPEPIVYDMSDLKKAETRIIADVVSGKLITRASQKYTSTHRRFYVRAVNADVRYEVDYQSMMTGTFSYLFINGKDYMHHDPSVFDALRVARCLLGGSDPGPQKPSRSLYWM